MDDVELNSKNLQGLLRTLKAKMPTAQVGVLGEKNKRANDGSNASIGAKHEFGDPAEGLPIRSWLRQPLIDQYQKFLNRAGAFKEDSLKEVMRTKSLVDFTKKLGIVAEAVIAEGFNTGGFGKWKPSQMQFKKNHQTLVETQQLRNSVISRVKE